VQVLYDRAFTNINITQLHKPMTSHFNDQLIIDYRKTMIGLKNIRVSQTSKMELLLVVTITFSKISILLQQMISQIPVRIIPFVLLIDFQS